MLRKVEDRSLFAHTSNFNCICRCFIHLWYFVYLLLHLSLSVIAGQAACCYGRGIAEWICLDVGHF